MIGDYSRQTFQPEKQYDDVLMQQGRVLLDAEFNEQQAIHRHRLHLQTQDEIGKCGTPKQDPGFEIVISDSSFKIGPGRYYVHGLLCRNENEIDYKDQNKGSLPALTSQVPANGTGLVYLEAYQTQVTFLQDPYLSEKALRIPGTTNRLQTVWQVRVLPLPGVILQANEVREKMRRGESLGTAWDNLVLPIDHLTRSKLIASTKPVDETSEDDPFCVLPPTAGYRGLTNQLYRVEIHHGTVETGGPSFKWSRENASMIAQVTGYSGSTVHISENARVGLISFPPGSWVELTDDVRDRNGQPGLLAKVTPSAQNLTLSLPSGASLESLLGAFDPTTNPRIILWDEGNEAYDANGNGIPISAGHGPYELESGIQVEFKGSLRTGDYWLIPARVETGQIEWRPYNDPAAPREEQPPMGTQHYFCPLAILRPGAAKAEDCRLFFPALNFIEASVVRFDNTNCKLINAGTGASATTVQEALDVLCDRPQGGGLCDIAISGSMNIESEIAALPAGQSAHICISVGDYMLRQPVYFRNLGCVSIAGAGRGTRILANESESAFVFENCVDVQVQDMTVISGVAGMGKEMGLESLNGTLTFRNCASVKVENVAVTCASAFYRSSACMTVASSAAPLDPVGAGSVRIRSCDLTVGFQQIGLLLLNVPRAQVEDNTMKAAPLPDAFAYGKLLNSGYKQPFLKLLRRRIFSNIQTGPTPPAGSRTNVTLNLPNHPTVYFYSPFLNQSFWDGVLRSAGPVLSQLELDVVKGLKTLADLIITQDKEFFRSLPDAIATIFGRISSLLRAGHTSAASQGIVVAGLGANDVRILNNTLQDFIQGVHVGFSGSEAGNPFAQTVLMSGNKMNILLPIYANRQRHGIFVGNCDSVTIENNYLKCLPVPGKAARNAVEIDGIRLDGQMGRRMLVRQNHIVQFTNGVYAYPRFDVGNPSLPASLWVITDNVMPSDLGNSTAVKVAQAVADYETANNTTVILRTPNYR